MIEITFYRLFIYVNVYVVKETRASNEYQVSEKEGRLRDAGSLFSLAFDSCLWYLIFEYLLLFCFNFIRVSAGNIYTMK